MQCEGLQNLQGLQIGELNHGAGASLELKGLNTMGVVKTEEGSSMVMEDDEEGEGTAFGDLAHGGNAEFIGNHHVGKATTVAGGKIISHGQRTKRAAGHYAKAAPAEAPPTEEEPYEEEAPEEQPQEELVNLGLCKSDYVYRPCLLNLQGPMGRGGLMLI